jgi:hypothetical protein
MTEKDRHGTYCSQLTLQSGFGPSSTRTVKRVSVLLQAANHHNPYLPLVRDSKNHVVQLSALSIMLVQAASGIRRLAQ